MDENNTALSQDAIDALLDKQADQDDSSSTEAVEEATVEDAAAKDADSPGPELDLTEDDSESADEPEAVDNEETTVADEAPSQAPPPVTIDAPPPPGAKVPPGVIHVDHSAEPERTAVDEERASMIAQEAAVSAMAPLRGDLGTISGRLDTLEAALKKIDALEAEVARLKGNKTGASETVSLEEMKPLVDRLMKLEKAAKSSPVFNLYDKFTCASCDNQGAAQVKARCGSCGKEGWFGRKKSTSKDE